MEKLVAGSTRGYNCLKDSKFYSRNRHLGVQDAGRLALIIPTVSSKCSSVHTTVILGDFGLNV